ncbi:ATP-dependent RNA helicase [Desulfosarcina variabilis str. Montpellier]|uniref:SNF2-related protein n=1 Tax=Desulfosarcina variabilis TaxID=2300 RepID=UPI003AFA223E
MATTKAQKKKTKRKNKLQARKKAQHAEARSDRADFFYAESQWYQDQGNLDKALHFIKKTLKLAPTDIDSIKALANLGFLMDDPDVKLDGLTRLYRSGQMEDLLLPQFANLLVDKEKYELAMETIDLLIDRMPSLKVKNRRQLRSDAEQLRRYCQYRLQTRLERSTPTSQKAAARPTHKKKPPAAKKKAPPAKEKIPAAPPNPTTPEPSLPDIPVTVVIDRASFEAPLSAGLASTYEQYQVALESQRIRFRESFENLICLPHLTGVHSLWYQEETARKVMRSLRGRALLSDEVGLGKTIEACVVLKEYIQRGMVKSALILTPTPLVSQWQEELQAKFALDFPSTDDPDFRKSNGTFWEQPFILASINQAKSKRNVDAVTAREYDMVIVDEAHHLKNRNTLNWKLVNALKKRFLLLLTATPVENNLMELYNLITLLKPGQLKTASAFREQFMTKGDPTSPQNRSRLKELLGQVMIRNTRAVAKINIPPRFAETVRVDPTSAEKELYERINTLVQAINQANGTGNKLLLKHLLAEAGSSPQAVELTLSRMLGKKELLLDHEKQIRAIRNLTRSMGDTQKNKVLLKLIRGTPGKMIIFVKYMGTLDHISDFLAWQKIPHAVFHGQMKNAEKDAQIEQFKAQSDILVTTEIGGEGRNLQFCHQMINYDLPWNPMKIEQRIGRIHRIGQEKEVRIFNLCAANSIEDYILEILDRKINMFEMVIGEIEMVLGRVRGEKDFSDRVYEIWMDAAVPEARQKGFDQLATQLKRSKTRYHTTKQLDENLFGENYEL